MNEQRVYFLSVSFVVFQDERERHLGRPRARGAGEAVRLSGPRVQEALQERQRHQVPLQERPQEGRQVSTIARIIFISTGQLA